MRHLFVISDLHLGGRPDQRDASGAIHAPGSRICNACAELIQFIDWIASGNACPTKEAEIVLNGDTVDFLADDDFGSAGAGAILWTANETDAILKLDRIATQSRIQGERGVFEAFRDLLARGARLTLILGNHDVELALPAVRRHLRKMLGAEDGRFHMVYDGEAYSVGRVLMEHGNRYDAWNQIDHSALRQERSMRSRGLPVRDSDRGERYFRPPAGTHLVIHFMNRIKARYRFVDLLKPETEAVIPLLLVLEPTRRTEIRDILRAAPVLKKRLDHTMREPGLPSTPGDMGSSATQGRGGLSLNGLLSSMLRKDAEPFLEPECSVDGDMGLRNVADDLKKWWRTQLKSWKQTSESLSAWAGIALPPSDQNERLRRLWIALKHLNRADTSFNLDRECMVYKRCARKIVAGGQFDIVIFGHTHLPKVLPLRQDEGGRPPLYYNTGTWCDVMRLPLALLDTFEAARPVLQAFVAAIRENDFSPYVRRYLSFVEVVVDDDGRVYQSALHSYGGIGRERGAPLTDALCLDCTQ